MNLYPYCHGRAGCSLLKNPSSELKNGWMDGWIEDGIEG
jgi:hypothetical protein